MISVKYNVFKDQRMRKFKLEKIHNNGRLNQIFGIKGDFYEKLFYSNLA